MESLIHGELKIDYNDDEVMVMGKLKLKTGKGVSSKAIEDRCPSDNTIT